MYIKKEASRVVYVLLPIQPWCLRANLHHLIVSRPDQKKKTEKQSNDKQASGHHYAFTGHVLTTFGGTPIKKQTIKVVKRVEIAMFPFVFLCNFTKLFFLNLRKYPWGFNIFCLDIFVLFVGVISYLRIINIQVKLEPYSIFKGEF